MPDGLAFFQDRPPVRVSENSPHPEDALAVFSNSEELARASDVRSMDAARSSLLNTSVVPSKTRAESAAMLWAAAMLLTEPSSRDAPSYWTAPYLADSFGNRKYKTSEYELVELTHFFGRDEVRDAMFLKLHAYQRRVLRILHSDYERTSRWIWTAEQTVEIAQANADKLKTTADPILMFRQARQWLVSRAFLKKVTYEEFASSPKYTGVSLI